MPRIHDDSKAFNNPIKEDLYQAILNAFSDLIDNGEDILEANIAVLDVVTTGLKRISGASVSIDLDFSDQ